MPSSAFRPRGRPQLDCLATEWRVYVFVVRLLAFCMILYGIFEKNRA